MPRHLIDEALAHAERADTAVAAAIWLRAARVMARHDRDAARQLIERGVTAARTVDVADRDPLMHTAISMAATVDPAAAIGLAARELDGHLRDGAVSQAFFHMADHGLTDEAAAILMDPPERLSFPFTAATNVISRARDDDAKQRILEGAVRAFRRERHAQAMRSRFERSQFVSLFTFHWKRLPPEMAREIVHELVQEALDDPDTPVHGSIGFGAARVQFSSSRQQRLFDVFEPLRELDPAMADSLIAANPQLAKAANAMPFGKYGDRPVAPPAHTERQAPIEQPDFMQIGDRLMPMPEALATGFAQAFQIAERKFDDDTGGGNIAPKDAWPSAQEYRKILFKAGQHEGREASRHLERIPDPDLRMFAAIELAAALSDLPQAGGITMSAGRRSQADRRDRPPATSSMPRHLAEQFAAVRVAPQPRQPLPLPTKPEMPASREAHIKPSARRPGDRPSGGAGSDFWTMEGVPLRPLLSKIYDTAERRIELPAALEQGRFDVMLVLDRDESHETMKRLMRESINRYFGVEVARESPERDVYVVAAPDGIRLKPALRENFGFSSVGYTSRDSSKEDLSELYEACDLHQIMDLHMAGESRSMEDMLGMPSWSIDG
jgi:hypothetical protein